jgi:hypothetical protein
MFIGNLQATKILAFVIVLGVSFAAHASDPFGTATNRSVDTRDKLVVGRWSNSIVGGLEPCMVSGRTCPAVWVRLYRLGTRDPVGTLVKTGSAHWREYSYSDEGNRIVGNARFNFQEQRRSGNVIQLHDPSRNVQLEIDLDDDVVRYGEDGGSKRPLYTAWGLRDLR